MENDLPLYAFTTSNVTGETMMIIRGEQGLHWERNLDKFTPDELNAHHGVTPEQLKAMEIGALFGWDKLGANPKYHNSILPEKVR